MKTGAYTHTEAEFIEKNYHELTDAEIAFFLDRDRLSITNYRRRNNLRKNGYSRSLASFTRLVSRPEVARNIIQREQNLAA